jgi:hypothetical protein
MLSNDANANKINKNPGNGHIPNHLPTLLHTTRIQSIAK